MLDNERKEGLNGGVWDTVKMVFLLIIKTLHSTACLRGIISIFASGQERLQFMDIKCVIFDFDGTLADTAEGILRTEEAMLKEMGLPKPEGGEAQMRQGIGLALRDSLHVGCRIPEELLDRAVETYRRLFDEIAFDFIVPFPGTKETLQYLYDKGYQLGIATSRSRRTLVYLLDQMGIAQYFTHLTSVESTPNHKPAPDLALILLDQFQISGDQALVVGDTVYDLQMGKNACCHTCGVTFGNHTREQLSAENPDFLVDSFPALESIL